MRKETFGALVVLEILSVAAIGTPFFSETGISSGSLVEIKDSPYIFLQNATYAQVLLDANESFYLFHITNGDLYYREYDPLHRLAKNDTLLFSNGTNHHLHVELDSYDHFHIVWSTDHFGALSVMYMKMDLSGTYVVSPAKVSDNNSYNDREPKVGPNSMGQAFIYWDQQWSPQWYAQDAIYAMVDSDGSILVPPTYVAPSGWDTEANLKDLLVDSDDNLHVVYCLVDRSIHDEWVYYKKIGSDGTTVLIDNKQLINDVYYYWHGQTRLLLDSNNQINFAYSWGYKQGSLESSEVWWAKLDLNGTVLFGPVSVTQIDGTHSVSPYLVNDEDENNYVLWSDKKDGNWEAYYAVLDSEGNFLKNETRITNTSADTLLFFTSAVVDSNGDCFWVYYEPDGAYVVYTVGPEGEGPFADAGPDQTVDEGDTVQFNGTGSYDPDGGVYGWKVLSNMSLPRMSLAVAAVGQKIYAIGGNLCDEGCGGPVTQVPEHVVSAVEVYDATQDSWYEGVSMPTNRSELAAATVSDKIYAIGGTKGIMVMPFGTLGLNEEYDPVTSEWKSRAGMPTPRAAFGIVAVDGKIYAIGGYHFMPMSFYKALNVTEVYDPITDTWTTRSPMPTSRSFLALAALDRKIYAIGGMEAPRLVEVYDIDTDTWTTATEMPPMPSNRSLRGIKVEALAGRIYVMGGYYYDCVLSGVISYDPKTDQWRSEPRMNHPRAYLASVTIGNAIYATGGTYGFMCGNPKPAEKFEAAGELTYEWDFDASTDSDGDGNHTNDVDGTGPTPTHIYGDNGIYTVTLTVKDEYGASDSDTMNVTVGNLPPGTTDPVIFGYGDEGSPVWGLTGDAIDPGSDDLIFEWDYGDGTSETKIHYNNGISPEPTYDPTTNEVKSPWGVFPFSVSDRSDHVYGDNGVYPVSLTIFDDDGGVVVFSTADSTIENVPPILSANVPSIVDEGDAVLFSANAVDNGTDDLTFIWDWGDGTPASMTTYYNNAPVNTPDPYPSPWGTYPFSSSDGVSHIYGDDGSYLLTLTVEDDDGGSTSYQKTITVLNVNPTVSINGPYSGDENTEIYFFADATDPGSDDLTFAWELEYGPTITSVYYNDGMNPDPPQSPWGIFPFSTADSVSNSWGDNGNFTVTLTVTDDDGGFAVQQTVAIVNNVAPTIESTVYYLNASFAFRIAGEKWHNVEIHLYEDGTEVGYASITRYPGSPNEQMVALGEFSVDFSKTYSAVAYYTPEDDPINGQIWGATPAWVILEYEDGEERIHHTFNVRHEDTWTWVIDDFSPYFLGHNITFVATASDPGSDDLTFTWNWGDGNTTENVYYNDEIGPDPYPSPEVNPISVTDAVRHGYSSAGTYVITLTVTDDDGGAQTIFLLLAI